MADITRTPLNNKSGPLHVPGLHGLPINVLVARDQFATGVNSWRAPILTAKELAILRLVNAITDRPDWHRAIFDQHVIAQWREDAIASASLINDKTWDWCLQELQDKARQFDRDGRLVVFNTNSGVYKSDTAISPALKSQLSNSVERLLSRQAAPQKSEAEQKSWMEDNPAAWTRMPGLHAIKRTRSCQIGHMWYKGGTNWSWEAGQSIWSSKFQWLPCEVDFAGRPGSTDVQISSYINNLHPTNCEMYSAIEAVISGSIKQWNEILVRNKWVNELDFHGDCIPCPREPMRIRTYGVEWKAQFPEWAKKLPPKEDEGKLSAKEYEVMCAQVETYLQEPESADSVHWQRVRTESIPQDWKTRWGLLRTALTKYAHTFVFDHSDPGTAYSYEDWKVGRTGKPIVGPSHDYYVCSPEFEHTEFMEANPWLPPYEWMFAPKEKDPGDHKFYTVALQDEFREKGLQVVVRINSIELDPETPSFPGTEWHIEGNANERIVSNSIYALDLENVSEPQISFRQRCTKSGPTWVYDRIGAVDSDDDEDTPDDVYMRNALWDLKYIGRLFGVEDIQYSPGWQQLGEVTMPSGRLISFPNAFQRRMGPVQLQDNSKPGHCRFLTLSLVDPTYRLCSTRNVLPQQPDWIPGDGAESAMQMDLAEALELREELVKEHAKKEEGVWKLPRKIYFSGFS